MYLAEVSPAATVIPVVGNAGASAQLGAYQQPDAESDAACNVTVIGSPDVLLTCKRPCLIPGYHLRNASQSAVTVFGDPAVTGSAARLADVPSQRSNAPYPAQLGAGTL